MEDPNATPVTDAHNATTESRKATQAGGHRRKLNEKRSLLDEEGTGAMIRRWGMHPPHYFLPVLRTGPHAAQRWQERINPIVRCRQLASRIGAFGQKHINGIDEYRIRIVIITRRGFWLAILLRIRITLAGVTFMVVMVVTVRTMMMIPVVIV